MATTDERTDRDHDTLALVKKFKEYSKENRNLSSLDRSHIEIAIGRIRSRIFDKKEWEQRFPDTDVYDQSFRWRLMAYTNDPDEAEDLMKKLMPQEKPTKTCFTTICSRLHDLNQREKEMNVRDFLCLISRIPDAETPRADRLFYIYMNGLIGEETSYTVEDAHEQVSAIRLLHFETNDEEKLKHFAKRYKKFDDAYAHLQELIRKREEEKARRTPPPTPPRRESSKSIVSKPRNSSRSPNRSASSRSGHRDDNHF